MKLSVLKLRPHLSKNDKAEYKGLRQGAHSLSQQVDNQAQP